MNLYFCEMAQHRFRECLGCNLILITRSPKLRQAKGIIYIMDTNKSFTSVEKLDVVGWPESAHFEPHGIHYWEHQNSGFSFDSIGLIVLFPVTFAALLSRLVLIIVN